MQKKKDVENTVGPVSDDLPYVSEDENLTEIIKQMMATDGPVLVKNKNKVTGVITTSRVLQTIIEGAETS